MKSNYPDPSTTNQVDFYSSAFRIKRLLRRRGLQNVEPMNGDIFGLMPPNLFKEWSSFNQRQRFVREKNGGKEFERFVSQIISQYYCNPATFSNKVLDLAPGGDFDILVEAPGETLFHFETKTALNRNPNIPDMWNFLVRESRLGSDMSVFLLDVNYDIEKQILRTFEILYALAEHITNQEKLIESKQISLDWLLSGDTKSIIAFHRKIENQIYYLFFPVLIINGGDNIKKNIGRAISIYFNGIRYISPYSRLSRERTGSIFSQLPNWNDLPKEIKKEVVRKKITNITSM